MITTHECPECGTKFIYWRDFIIVVKNSETIPYIVYPDGNKKDLILIEVLGKGTESL